MSERIEYPAGEFYVQVGDQFFSVPSAESGFGKMVRRGPLRFAELQPLTREQLPEGVEIKTLARNWAELLKGIIR